MLVSRDERDFVKGLLSPTEQSYLEQLAKNPEFMDAIKKIILIPVYYSGTLKAGKKPDPNRNFMLSITNRRDLSNEELGNHARAVAEACAMIDAGFSYLESLKPIPERSEKDKNEAR